MFGPDLEDVRDRHAEEAFWISMEAVGRWQARWAQVPVGRQGARTLIGIHPLSHSHFVYYGGEYYAYLYAKHVAASIWTKHFEKDPLARAAGMKMWGEMLALGASRDPADKIANMLSN